MNKRIMTLEEFLQNEAKQITKEEFGLILVQELQREEDNMENECLDQWFDDEQETIANQIIDELFEENMELSRVNEGLEMEIEFLNEQLDDYIVCAVHNEILIEELELMSERLENAQKKLEITQQLLRVYLGLE